MDSSNTCNNHSCRSVTSSTSQDHTINDSNSNFKMDDENHKSSTKSYDLDLDSTEIDKLFGILYEPDLKAFNDIFGSEYEHVSYKPLRRFAPYPVHQQLYIQQQQEQERRRQSLTSTVSNRRISYASRDHYDAFRYRETKYMYSEMFRNKIVRTVIAFIDKFSNRIISTQNDCNEKCVVCMCNYQVDQGLRELRCNHKFHRKCIDEWLVKSYICPVCRTDLTGTGRIFRGLAVLYHIWKEEGSVFEQNPVSTNLHERFDQNIENDKSESSSSESVQNSCKNKNCSCKTQAQACIELLPERSPDSGS